MEVNLKTDIRIVCTCGEVLRIVDTLPMLTFLEITVADCQRCKEEREESYAEVQDRRQRVEC